MSNKDCKHMYFSLDSDVLSNLADLYKLRISFPDAEQQEIKENLKNIRHSTILANFNFYNHIIDLALEDKIRLLVTPTPYYESRHVDGVLNFIKNVCYVPKMNMLNYEHKAYVARKLAEKYCSNYSKDGKKMPPPISPKYDANVGSVVPTNDAYVMAEATLNGACLLTENKRDLIKSRKQEFDDSKKENHKNNEKNESGNDRVAGIININVQSGYAIENDSEICDGTGYIVPRPYDIETAGKILKFKFNVAGFPRSHDEMYEKGSDLIR